MTKYLKKFDIHNDYTTYIEGNEKILPNVSLCKDNLDVHYNPLANIIKYKATAKLAETTEQNYHASGLRTNAFNTTIKQHSFENGNGIIVFEEDVTSVGDYAFMNSNNLISIKLPNTITSIGEYAFNTCINLVEINIPNSVTSIGGHAFTDSQKITTIRMPNTVTTIGESAFSGCNGLEKLILSNNITTFDNYAFGNCRNLKGILIIPNTTTSIGNSAFSLTGLKKVIIGNNITSIGSMAFHATNLISVTIQATTPPTIGTQVFGDTTTEKNYPIYVPAESLASYQAANNWSFYASRIQAIQ